MQNISEYLITEIVHQLGSARGKSFPSIQPGLGYDFQISMRIFCIKTRDFFFLWNW